MGAIDNYLTAIGSAVYGEEVRSSIINGIRRCYTDAVDVVKVSTTQPTSENTKIWIKPESDEYKVPTWDEFQTEKTERQYGDGVAFNNTAPTYDETLSYEAGKMVINGGILYLLPNGHAANQTWESTNKEIVNLADQLDQLNGKTEDLKSALEQSTGSEPITDWHEGHYLITNGTSVNPTDVKNNSSARYVVIECSPGDVFTLNNKGGNTSLAYVFCKSNNDIINSPKAAAGEQQTNKIVIAPAETSYMVLNDNKVNGAWSDVCFYGKAPIARGNELEEISLTTYQTMITTESALNEATGNTKNVGDFPLNSIIYVGSTITGITGCPETLTSGGFGCYLTFKTNKTTSGKTQMFTNRKGFATRTYISGNWTAWVEVKGTELTENVTYLLTQAANIKNDEPDVFSVTFDSSTKNIDYPLKAGKKYKFTIPSGTLTSGKINLYAKGDTSNYVSVLDGDSKTFVPAIDSNQISVFKPSDTVLAGDSVSVKVTPPLFVDDGNVYYVGATREHTSFVSLLLDLIGDDSEKTIYIDNGTYNIYDEYIAEVATGRIEQPDTDTGSFTNYFEPYNAFIPNNTKVIGLGNVVLQFTPTVSDYINDGITHYIGASKTWSPINIYGSVEIENITVIGKNCRYCMHNDDHNQYPGSRQHYKNCRFLYTYSDTGLGFNNTIGFGINQEAVHIFEDCEIYMDASGNSPAYYGHDRSDAYDGTLILKNCRIHSSNFSSEAVIRFQTLATSANAHVTALFENCYINGGVRMAIANDANIQGFDVTFVNCNKVDINPSGSSSNQYSVTWYNPQPTPTAEDPLIETETYGG